MGQISTVREPTVTGEVSATIGSVYGVVLYNAPQTIPVGSTYAGYSQLWTLVKDTSTNPPVYGYRPCKIYVTNEGPYPIRVSPSPTITGFNAVPGTARAGYFQVEPGETVERDIYSQYGGFNDGVGAGYIGVFPVVPASVLNLIGGTLPAAINVKLTAAFYPVRK